jgi:hypothetical protein
MKRRWRQARTDHTKGQESLVLGNVPRGFQPSPRSQRQQVRDSRKIAITLVDLLEFVFMPALFHVSPAS